MPQKSLSTIAKNAARGILLSSGASEIPIKIKQGLAKGYRVTLYPCTANWRLVPEADVETVLDQIKDEIRGKVCWDFGSHFGRYTLSMHATVGEEGGVYSFEPNEYSFNKLQKHIKINNLQNAKAFNVGLSEEPGVSQLWLGAGEGSTYSHLKYPGEDEEDFLAADTVQIQLESIDHLLAEGLIEPASFIKVDVEGHGGAALRGAKNFFKDHRPHLLVSFHSTEEVDEIRELLEPLGYTTSEPIGDFRPTPWMDFLGKSAWLKAPES